MSATSPVLQVIVAAALGALVAAPAAAQSRGELLYSTHCIACHTSQMHWRESPAATDWSSLKTQVRRWQNSAALAWNEIDILEVTRYLNESFYHFEQTADAPRAASSLPSVVAGGAEARNGRLSFALR